VLIALRMMTGSKSLVFCLCLHHNFFVGLDIPQQCVTLLNNSITFLGRVGQGLDIFRGRNILSTALHFFDIHQ